MSWRATRLRFLSFVTVSLSEDSSQDWTLEASTMTQRPCPPATPGGQPGALSTRLSRSAAPPTPAQQQVIDNRTPYLTCRGRPRPGLTPHLHAVFQPSPSLSLSP